MNFLLIALCCLLFPLQAQIIEAPNLEPIEKALSLADQKTLVMFDVDDTLLVPKDLILKACSRSGEWKQKVRRLIDNENLLGQVLSQIEYEPVNPRTKEIIRHLTERQIRTIAFTKMPIGPCGDIQSMEDWRLSHLRKHQFDFSLAFPEIPLLSLQAIDGKISLFKEGLLCANRQNKGPVLNAFLEKLQWKPSKIIFIDNRLDYLESVEEALSGSGIEYVGFYYTEEERRPLILDEALAKFQVDHLIKTGKWLNDLEATINYNK